MTGRSYKDHRCPGEGKTTIAVNLAISLAELGERVLLIDGDLRRPCIHEFLDIQDHRRGTRQLPRRTAGVAQFGSCDRSELDSLLCGLVPPNPSELLCSERMQRLISLAMTEYPFVLVDAPPLLNVADGRIPATMVEGAVFSRKSELSPPAALCSAHSVTFAVSAGMWLFLNYVDLHHAGYGYYRKYYSRYNDPTDGWLRSN